jgi:glucosamine kinase
MSLFIGVDGGGTKTKCVLVDNNLKILTNAEGTSSNPFSVGINQSAVVIVSTIKQALQLAGLNTVDGIVVGAAGAGRKKNSEELKQAVLDLLIKEDIITDRFQVVSDAEIAVEGAFAGNPGAILIAGTGSIIFGKDKNGSMVRAGGFGKILGDEGSGYSIGKKTLNAAAKYLDEKNDKNSLIKLIKKNLGINDFDGLILKVYTKNFDIASIAGEVIKAAGLGNKTCKKILDEESDELIFYLKIFRKKLNQKKFKLCFSGGLISSKNYYSKILIKKIKKYCKEIELTKQIYPPEIGAALLAKKLFTQNRKELKNDY